MTRVLRFVEKHHEGKIPVLSNAHEEELDRVLLEECGTIEDPAEAIVEFRFRRACERLVTNASVANVFVDREAPWALRKTDPARSASVLNTCCQWIAWIARWMVPFMPDKAQEIWSMVGAPGDVSSQDWPGLPSAGRWRILEPGAPLGVIGSPFTKLTDEEIQREIDALVARAENS